MPEPAFPHPAVAGERLAAVITQRTQALAADVLQLRADADRLAAVLARGISTEDTARLTVLAQRIHGQACRIEGLHDARSLT
ncbi:hypothetical protein J5Y04_31285 [Kitasatospora sp. RG8]|uniref:hypothetical protein n=1 Tax=Kitasatospora sp. RG8 TaxID=2820815 RepID=UPI001ADF3B37|nr:hypothetical protein [Kitasatospora sp. RG8]MBP0453992.1 hypothetical protein [Kitasatospora sp. RG8]